MPLPEVTEVEAKAKLTLSASDMSFDYKDSSVFSTESGSPVRADS